jgi:hypothetical protein
MSVEIVENCVIGKLESFEELWAYIMRPPLDTAKTAIAFRNTMMKGEINKDFEGPETATKSIEEVKEWMLNGWEDGERQAQKNIDQVFVPTVRQIKRRGAWAENGDDLSQDRLYSGDIDTMWRTTKKKSTIGNPRIKICVQNGGHSYITPEQMFWRYAAAIPFADSLIESGYHVAIDSFSVTKNTWIPGSNLKCARILRVKEFTQPLNRQYVAAILGSAAYFRRFGFMFYGACTELVEYDISVGLGQTVSESDLSQKEWRALFGEEDALTLFASKDILSKEDANDWIKDALIKIQGEIPA